MEIEEHKSRFLRDLEIKAVKVEKFFDAESRESFLYKIPAGEDTFFRRALSYLYRWLDAMSGQESTFFVSPEYLIKKPYMKLAGFLKQKGIIDSVSFKDLRYNDAPAFCQCWVYGSYPEGVTDGIIISDLRGFSTGVSSTRVFSRALGEFLERYFLTIYKKSSLIFSSVKSLRNKTKILDLTHLAGFSDEQKKKHPKRVWTEDSVFGWEKTERISTKEKFFVPTQLIYWNYKLDEEKKEPFLREPNTNGAGGYFTKEEAILSGLYELVQRDAFLAFWLSGKTPPKIEPETVPDEEFQSILSSTRRYGFEIHLLNTTFDTGIPSFVAVLEDLSGNSPCLIFGGGCQADPVKALLRAFEETWSLYELNRGSASAFELPEDYQPFKTGLGHTERVLLAAKPKMKNHYEFFLKGEKKNFSEYSFDLPKDFPSKKEELTFAVRKVESLGRGYEVYAYIGKHPLLKELGYESVKVIVPALLPLYLQETHAPLGASRLREILVKMGKNLEGINSWPHPFP